MNWFVVRKDDFRILKIWYVFFTAFKFILLFIVAKKLSLLKKFGRILHMYMHVENKLTKMLTTFVQLMKKKKCYGRHCMISSPCTANEFEGSFDSLRWAMKKFVFSYDETGTWNPHRYVTSKLFATMLWIILAPTIGISDNKRQKDAFSERETVWIVV